MIAGHRKFNEADKVLLDGLSRAGFKLDGEGICGLFEKYWRRGGLIIDGKVRIKQGQEIERFEETGIRFGEGSFLEADIIVLATGMIFSDSDDGISS